MDNKKIKALIVMIVFFALGILLISMENKTALTYIGYFVCFFIVGWNLSTLITRKKG